MLAASIDQPGDQLKHAIRSEALFVVTKKAYPLRINEQVLAALQRWADDDLRSLNAQIEFVLRDALVKSGRVKLVQKVVTDVESTIEDAEAAEDQES
jgi:hypothetical protein